MELSIGEKYLEALKQIDGWTTVSAWAIKVGEIYPDILEKTHQEAINQKTPSTGLREIAARISSNISRAAYADKIEIDESERPRKVRFIQREEFEANIQKEIEEDIEPLTRAQKIKTDVEALSTSDAYRISELEAIANSLNSFFELDFEVDHARALLNATEPGNHHPDNLQILLKSHNRKKSSYNWQRFTIEEQITYIQAAIRIQNIIAKRMGVDIPENVIESILERLRLVY